MTNDILDDPASAPSDESLRAAAFASGPPEWRGQPLRRSLTISGLCLFHELRESVGAPPLADTISGGRFLADALRILWICAEEEPLLIQASGNLSLAKHLSRKWADANVTIAEAPEAIALALHVWNQAHENKPEIIPAEGAPSGK